MDGHRDLGSFFAVMDIIALLQAVRKMQQGRFWAEALVLLC